MAAKASLILSQEEEEDEEVASDASEVEEEEDDEKREAGTAVPRCVPRRPRRAEAARGMAARQRVQRVVVLAGPGQPHARSPPSAKEAFMTHLPDSPPRGILSRPTMFQFADARWKAEPRSPRLVSPRVVDRRAVAEETAEQAENAEEDAEQRPEVDESYEEEEKKEQEEEEEEEEERGEASCGGPQAIDIQHFSTTNDATINAEEEEEEEEAFLSEDDTTEDEEEADDAAYRELQAACVRLQAEQLERDALREELASYVATLAAKRDADGEQLVAFPRNFQQILSLMTARDIETDADVSAPPAAKSSAAAAPPSTHKSWSQILIQNSLAKQHAFGTLDESDETGEGGDSGLAAKIALKMARIRQLDAILEEKLGKNLYATATMTAVKKTKRVNPQEPEVVSSAATRLSMSKGPAFSTDSPSTTSLNFIERNRKVVENGAKANLTRDEEQRVRRLLRGLKTQNKHEAGEAGADMASATPEPAEFRLEQHEQQEIEKLIVDKRGVYASAVVMALDDISEEEEAEEPSGANKTIGRKTNIVQETKRERLRRQRLQRIEEELAFLRNHESVPILPDDIDDDASDGCSSERSFMTTTSMLSTASTRSGVTRRQLDQFVAAEVSKAAQGVDEKASRDEINMLVRSLSHLPITTARPATTTTV